MLGNRYKLILGVSLKLTHPILMSSNSLLESIAGFNTMAGIARMVFINQIWLVLDRKKWL
jgi:hypothetical protein